MAVLTDIVLALIGRLFNQASLVFVWAMFVDYLVYSGFLLPEQRELWVSGGLQIVGGLGFIFLSGIYLHHKLDHEKQMKLAGTLPAQTPFSFMPLVTWAMKKFNLSSIFVLQRDTPQP